MPWGSRAQTSASASRRSTGSANSPRYGAATELALTIGRASPCTGHRAGHLGADHLRHSSFLLHAQRAAERYEVPAHAILQRVGEAGYVGAQEDMIIDVALRLQAEKISG
ncbi:MAG: hypothetical protein WAK82_19505 [Streptosporangiaceae bacterium]